jgi:hypothetical protein
VSSIKALKLSEMAANGPLSALAQMENELADDREQQRARENCFREKFRDGHKSQIPPFLLYPVSTQPETEQFHLLLET